MKDAASKPSQAQAAADSVLAADPPAASLASSGALPSLRAMPNGPVAVIGAGTIGAGWAALFALHGLEVRVADPSPAAAATLAATLQRARAVMSALRPLQVPPREPQLVTHIAQAVQGTTHIQEALPEQLDLKRRAYAEIEANAPPDALIASSSSGLPPSVLQEGLCHPERLLIVHPCNPPYLMPLVELVGGRHTSAVTIAAARAFYEALGKKTVELRREAPGHLVNRLQAALWREAVYLVAEGYASAADVDRAVTDGLGARWAVCGPHMIFHLAGGNEGIAGFLDRLGDAVEQWWADLGTPELDAATRQALVDGMTQASCDRNVEQLAALRDAGVVAMLAAQRRLRR